MKKTLPILFLIIFITSLPATTYAWGKIGHRVVAQIAYRKLKPKALHKLQMIMPFYEQFVDCANYLDDVRADSVQPYPKMPVWHFITLNDDNLSFEQFIKSIQSDTNQNAYKTIVRSMDSLKKNPNNLFWLKVLIHVAGDISQPLHIGRAEDQGGNLLPVNWQGTTTNLHAVWDNKVIQFLEYSATELSYFVNTIETESAGKDLEHWCYDTYQKRKIVYNSLYLIDARTHKKERDERYFAYELYYKDMIFRQLEIGGTNLAILLNMLYGG